MQKTMINKLKFAAILTLCAVLLSGCQGLFGISQRNDGDDQRGYTSTIHPDGEGMATGQLSTAVYFGYEDDSVLAPSDEIFTLTADTTIEQLILLRLIQGPDASAEGLRRLINPNTTIKGISEQNGYLSIMLSKEFLEPYQGIDAGAQTKRLAVYSIVNSVTELGLHSRVLLLVDKEGNGTGDRLTAAEAGFQDLGSAMLEPLTREPDLIITPDKTIEICLSSIMEKNYGRLEQYLAQTDLDDDFAPSGQALAESLGSLNSIASFNVLRGISISQDGTRATATVSLSYVNQLGQLVELEHLPLLLIREEVWKLSFSSLAAGLTDGAGS